MVAVKVNALATRTDGAEVAKLLPAGNFRLANLNASDVPHARGAGY